jgi:hypothetical protein
MDKFLFYLLDWLGKSPEFSAQTVRLTRQNPALLKQLEFLLFNSLKRGVKIMMKDNRECHFLANSQTLEVYFNWLVPDNHREWAAKILAPLQDQAQRETNLMEQTRSIPGDWERTERLWQKIEKESIYGLHLDGGDYLRFEVPEITTFRITGATLIGNGKFPEAKVLIHTDTLGFKEDVPFDLKSGRLPGAEIYWYEHLNYLVTSAVLCGYWQIVSGQTLEDEPWYAGLAKSPVNGKAKEHRPAKPHFYHLPPGHHASDEARQACRLHLGRELRDGCTFRAPKKIPICKKKKISATITPNCLQRMLADEIAV